MVVSSSASSPPTSGPVPTRIGCRPVSSIARVGEQTHQPMNCVNSTPCEKEPIDVRRGHSAAMHAQIAPADIVGQDVDDVRFGWPVSARAVRHADRQKHKRDTIEISLVFEGMC